MQYSAIATVLMLATLVLSISACSKQEFAEVFDYRDKSYTQTGEKRDGAPLDPEIAYKYQGDPEFSVEAEVDPVQTDTLEPIGEEFEQVQHSTESNVDAQRANIDDRANDVEYAARAAQQERFNPQGTAPNETPAPANMPKQPFKWPVKGEIISQYGELRGNQLQEGIVIRSPAGTPIRAAAGGEVAYVGSALEEFGTIAIIRHNDGFMTSYAHADEILVGKGQFVNPGEVIGYVGQTGNATEPQLHFTIRSGKQTVDPRPYLPN